MSRRRLPLDGIVVADFSRVLAGPLCTQMLGDAGARVIKVEEPERGDETRRWGPPFAGGVSAYFLALNRNKESIAIDLESRDGRKAAKRLVARADVVVDNFLPSQRAKLLPRNAKAVHCSISGFDSATAEANTPGYDLLAQAASGLMAITGEPDGEPMKAGVAVADVLTAHYAASAILAALYAREKTGRGERIEISLFSAAVASLVNVAQNALVTGREPERWGNAHPSIVPYQLFPGSDRPFAVGAGTDRHFDALCTDVIERPDLLRFGTNAMRVEHRDELVAVLDRTFRTKPAETWVARCRSASIPVALVQGVREALQSPAGRELVVAVDHAEAGRYEAVASPLLFSGRRFPIRSAPPLLGEHTEAIRRELNLAGGSTRRAARRTRPE